MRTDDSTVELRGAGTPGKFDTQFTHPDTRRECGRLPHCCLLTYGRELHSCQGVSSTTLSFGDKVVLDLPTVQPSTQVSPAELTWEWRNVNATQFAGTLSVTGKGACPLRRNVNWDSEEVGQLLTLWLAAPNGASFIPWINLNNPMFYTHRNFFAFGLLGNKGMHALNGNTKVGEDKLAWLQLIQTARRKADMQPKEVNDIGILFETVLNCQLSEHGKNTPLTLKHVEIHVSRITRSLLREHNIRIVQDEEGARYVSNMTTASKALFEARHLLLWHVTCSAGVKPFKTIPIRIRADNHEFELTRELANETPVTHYKWWSKAYKSHHIEPQLRIGLRQPSSPVLVAIPIITIVVCPTTSKHLTDGELRLLESIVNGTDIAALPCPNLFTGWNFEWTLNTCSVYDRFGTSEPVGESAALPNRQSLAEEGVA